MEDLRGTCSKRSWPQISRWLSGAEASARTSVALFLTVLLVISAAAPQPAQAQTQTYNCPSGFGAVVVEPVGPVLMPSLKAVPNPVLPKDPITGVPTLRPDLVEYVANVPAAIQLGKALFWDMQVGSDNKTACATCHFAAGADSRGRNQINPGANASWDASYSDQVSYGPNFALRASDFPYTVKLVSDHDNITGSQGVRKSAFQGIGKTGELVASVADPVFNVAGTNVRQVTGMNSPAVINAVFNHRNFGNGRAQPDFNGVNPFGARDSSARVWALSATGTPIQMQIKIANAGLASQAVGPVLNTVEMSAAGRTFPAVGKKMLGLKPLGLQKVDPTDSVLGSVADAVTGKGLNVTYASLIQKAFQPKWWKSTKSVKIGTSSYTMSEANFSLFWGLALMLYESTLVADDSPMDRYLASRVFDPASGLLVSHNPALLDPVVDRVQADFQAAVPGATLTRDHVLNGLGLFELPVPPTFPAPSGKGLGCIACHLGGETTSASVQALAGHGVEPGDIALKNAGFDLRMERMFMQIPPVPAGSDAIAFDPSSYTVVVTHISTLLNPTPPPVPMYARVATYDSGWYNIGVRPTAEDAGLGGTDPFGKPLSWTELFQTTLADPSIINVPGNGLGCATAGNTTFPGELLNAAGFPLLSGPLRKYEATDVAGSFKTAGLHNVELTGPYFHNGGKATLAQVAEFYDDGGDFDNPTKSPIIMPLHMSEEQRHSIVAFLLSLTDDRVRLQKAPFDHPQLLVPDGDSPAGTDNMVAIPAVGAAGSSPLQRFLNLNPFAR